MGLGRLSPPVCPAFPFPRRADPSKLLHHLFSYCPSSVLSEPLAVTSLCLQSSLVIPRLPPEGLTGTGVCSVLWCLHPPRREGLHGSVIRATLFCVWVSQNCAVINLSSSHRCGWPVVCVSLRVHHLLPITSASSHGHFVGSKLASLIPSIF